MQMKLSKSVFACLEKGLSERLRKLQLYSILNFLEERERDEISAEIYGVPCERYAKIDLLLLQYPVQIYIIQNFFLDRAVVYDFFRSEPEGDFACRFFRLVGAMHEVADSSAIHIG